MNLSRRKLLHLAAGAAALPALPGIARAQAWPSRPITLVTGIAGAGTIAVLAALLLGYSKQIDLAAVSAFFLALPMVLWLALAVILAVTPIALYFVYSDE